MERGGWHFNKFCLRFAQSDTFGPFGAKFFGLHARPKTGTQTTPLYTVDVPPEVRPENFLFGPKEGGRFIESARPLSPGGGGVWGLVGTILGAGFGFFFGIFFKCFVAKFLDPKSTQSGGGGSRTLLVGGSTWVGGPGWGPNYCGPFLQTGLAA